MIFSYTPKSDMLSVDHNLVVLVSINNGLNPEELLNNEVFYTKQIN